MLFVCVAFPSLLVSQAADGGALYPQLPAAGADARVQPGDQIGIRILREPELSGVFAVSEAGEATLPKLGVVQVGEQSAGTLHRMLRTAYARFLRDPSVEVTLLRRVGVHGEVRKPDLYMVDLTMTLRDVLARAGGITEAGNPERIEIVRDGQRFRVGQDRAPQLLVAELRSGDQVVVARRSWVARNPNVAVGTVMSIVGFFIGLVPLLKGL